MNDKKPNTVHESFGVVVVGGGLAGVCAAISSSRSGVRTLLIEQLPILGGNSSSLAGVPPHGATALGHNRNARESGILEELRTEYFYRYGGVDNRRFWDLLLEEWCKKESNLTLLLNTSLVNCNLSGNILSSIEALQRTTETVYQIAGKIFVDATGDAILAEKCHIPTRMGRESKDEFGEQNAVDQADGQTLGSTVYLIAQKRSYPVSFKPPGFAKRYPDCDSLQGRPHTIQHITPGNCLSPDCTQIRIFWWIEGGGDKHIINDSERIYQDLVAEALGIWDHLKNHCNRETREALDFYDLVWWSLVPLRRESRRILGLYTLKEDDLFNPKLFPDRIGYGGFPLDLHPPAGIGDPSVPCVQIFLNDLYSIPLRCFLVPEIPNLFVIGRSLSATHVALGSVRVMYTLGQLGQSIGIAAGICVKKQYHPPNLLDDGEMTYLQQSILKHDGFIPAIQNNDPEDHARTAKVTATSTMPFIAEDVDGRVELVCDMVQQVPFPGGGLDSLSFYLTSRLHRRVTLSWSLSTSTKLANSSLDKDLNEDILIKGNFSIDPMHDGWIRVPLKGIEIPPCILSLKLDRCEGVFWAFTRPELPGTRWGVRYEGSMEVEAFHGEAKRAPQRGNWFFMNHHGRAPKALEAMLRAHMEGEYETHRCSLKKPTWTFCCSFTPTFYPYQAENVVNGYSRATDFPNLWISDPREPLPQSITLEWSHQQAIKEVILIFDTNLDLEDRFYGYPLEKYRYSVPVPECISDYDVLLETERGWETVYRVRGNIHRKNSITFMKERITKALQVRVLATHGSREARIYEIRVY